MDGSRRQALKRGLALLGAAVGVGAASRAGLTGAGAANGAGGPGAGPAPPAPPPPQAATVQEFTLHGRRWHVSANGLRPGQLPGRGHRLVGQGELLDGPSGQPVGEFFATAFALDSPSHAGPDGAATLEMHTFNLAGGSIVGTGTARAALDAGDVFAIVGGTGRYAGARGTYVARQRPQELGGDGTAEFTLRLVTEEALHGGG